MVWSTPKTWTGEPLTSPDMNTEIRDNLNALKNPPSDSYMANESSNYTTTSTSFVNVDGTNWSFSLDTNGGDVFVHFDGSFGQSSNTQKYYLDVTVDGTRLGQDDGLVVDTIDVAGSHVIATGFTRLISGLSANTHVFVLQWKTQGGTLTMYAGAGTSGLDVHPQFWAREIS